MISQTAEYALRAMVYLAENTGQALPVPRIAEATQVPAGYLSKVLQSLARAGLVSSQRGLKGGFQLQRRAEELSLLDILAAVSPVERINACPLGLPHHEGRLCALHQRLDEAIAHFEGNCRDTSLADLLRARGEPTFPVAD
jgi:Rrf2 family protein